MTDLEKLLSALRKDDVKRDFIDNRKETAKEEVKEIKEIKEIVKEESKEEPVKVEINEVVEVKKKK